ncbi:MAG: YdcF family protein [Burkholderiales bacterium]
MLKKIFYIATVALGVLGVAATAVAALVSTGISTGVVLPGLAGAVLIAWGLKHILHPGPVIGIKWLRIAVTVIICIGLLSFAAIEAMIIAFPADDAPESVNFVIVPGCAIFPDGRLTLTLKNRLDAAYSYLVENEGAICIVSGGQGRREPTTEAEAMKNYLVSRGIDPSRIALEGNSFDTQDNMSQSSALMDNMFPGKKKTAVVATSDFHVLRAVTLARNNGIEAYGISAPTPWYIAVNYYMREYISVLKMALIDLK